jgi:hypothetical protein
VPNLDSEGYTPPQVDEIEVRVPGLDGVVDTEIQIPGSDGVTEIEVQVPGVTEVTEVVITDPDILDILVPPAVDVVEVIKEGQQGPQGPEGPTGLTGVGTVVSMTEPVSPATGLQWFQPGTYAIRVWDGSEWRYPYSDPNITGETKTYNYVIASATWTCVHNFASKPNVSTFDNSGNEIYGDISNPDSNTTVISFYEPQTGQAILQE